jgi:hypothetical protein
MDELEYSLREGATIEKGEGKRNCFSRITDMVEEYDANCYPTVNRKLYRYIRNTGDRLKIVCHLNRSCVSERDRQCSFFLIAASKDNGLSCKICKNVCIRHSCMTPDQSETIIPDNNNVIKESAHQLSKKRKAEEDQEVCRDAWRVLTSDRYFLNEAGWAAKTGFLEDMGVFEPEDMKDLEVEHIERLACLVKEVPSTKLRKLLLLKNKK